MGNYIATFFTDDNQMYGNRYHNPMELKLQMDRNDFIKIEEKNDHDYYLLPKSKIRLIHVKKEGEINGK